MKKKYIVFDHIRGRKREFKVGDKVCYLGQHDGVITEHGTVMLNEGMELLKVLSEQPHKLKKINRGKGYV
jgi:ABC-type uncharacterized transport system ATPase subunit